jgi:hypothetical protein
MTTQVGSALPPSNIVQGRIGLTDINTLAYNSMAVKNSMSQVHDYLTTLLMWLLNFVNFHQFKAAKHILV